MHSRAPLLQNLTIPEQAMLLGTILSFTLAWAIGYSAQEGIRGHLPVNLRGYASYRWAVDHYAFASTTPRYLTKRYVLSHVLLIVPCLCGLIMCVMISNRTAIDVCLAILAAALINAVRTSRQFYLATAKRMEHQG